MSIQDARSIPKRMEEHQGKNWFRHGKNHKTTLTMGTIVPMTCQEVYPGEKVRCGMEIQMKFAALYLPIMHQCYFTVDWFYVRSGAIFHTWERFIMQDPISPEVQWPYFNYKRADAVFTDGILNYMGFNAPPGAGTLIAQTPVSALPPWAYYQIWRWHFRNPHIQGSSNDYLTAGDNTVMIEANLPDLRVLRRNWPRDYYTIATLSPIAGANVLIPAYATDPVTGDYIAQKIFDQDGTPTGDAVLLAGSGVLRDNVANQPVVLQLSSTMMDFRHADSMQQFLERALRAGAAESGETTDMRYNDFVDRYFGWNPNPLMIDQPVWIGGYTGDIIIQDVMASAEGNGVFVGDYAGKAIARSNTQYFEYTIPDYGFIIPVMTVYPKASYYTGVHRMWTRSNKMDYMWEQFQFIGDQPMRNKEVWFSWYDADIAWNDEIFGYVPQYHWERYSNDIVSGQMRTLWESFHLGRKFTEANQVILDSDFITCTPDIGRVFRVDAEAGEHECFVHAYIDIQILRRLAKNAIPKL